VQVDGVGTLLVVSGDFAFVTDSGTQLRLAGPLLRVSGGASVNTEGDVLDVLQGAVVTGNGSSAFVQVDGVGSQLTTSIFGNNLVSLSGSGTQLSLGGSLLSVTGGATATLFRGVLGMANGATAVIGGDALIIGAGGGTITGPTDGTPLISVVSTTDLSVGGALVNLASSSSVMNLNGPILSMTGGVATATYGLVMAASASLTPGDPTPAAVALSLPVGTQSLGVAVTPNGAQAYVTDNGGSQVYAINTANDAATPVTVGSHPAGVGITPDGSLAYVANQGSNTVSVIDTSHNMVTATVPGLSTPYFGVAVANVPGVGTRAYVGNLGTNSVAVIDANPLSPTFNTVLTSISVGLGPVGLAVTPDGTRAYVVNQSSNSVSVIDNTTNTVIGSAIPVGSLPGSIIITPDGTKAYVANGVGNTLSVISTATNTVTGTVNVGAPAGGLAISPDGTRLYVTNGSPANTLTIINTADNSIVGTAISVGNSPAGIAVTPDGFRAFVAINGDPEFSIVAGLTAPLFQVAGGSLTMNSNLVFLPATASLTLTHPLLDVINTGSVTANADLISVGGTLAVNGLAPLVKVGGQGMLTLNGSLLSQNGSGSVNLGGSVLRVDAGGTVVSASTASVVLLPSGTHSFGSSAGSALFDLSGNPANTATEVDQGNTLTLGTDRPIKGAGDCSSDCSLQVSLLETGGTGTTTVMVGGSAVKIDTALLESSLPILNLKPGSSLTLGADAVDLSMKAKVTSLGAFLKLDGASLTVDVGSLVNVRNGSFLSVMGDLLQLSNSSTLTLNSLSDGFLVNISGGSVLKVSGALVAFTAGAGNSVIVKNTVSPNATVDGVPVHLANGATISQVDIGGTPIRVNAGAAGSLTFLNTGSLINVDGPTAKISISGLTPP
jgi:YVTN family beta-propeller protein